MKRLSNWWLARTASVLSLSALICALVSVFTYSWHVVASWGILAALTGLFAWCEARRVRRSRVTERRLRRIMVNSGLGHHVNVRRTEAATSLLLVETGLVVKEGPAGVYRYWEGK